MNKDMKTGLAIGTAFAALVSAMPTKAQPIMIEENKIVAEQETSTEDVIMGAGGATTLIASVASWAAPMVVTHSSGAAIMYSGAGYVAGTIGLGAATVAALPIIATAGVVTAGGAYAYKHRETIADKWNYYFGEEE